MALLFLTALLSGCDPEPFHGYLVAKEYTPGHMCHDGTRTYSYAYVPVVVVHHHVWKYPEWNWFIANRSGVRCVRVDSATFNTRMCGDTLTLSL